MLTLSVTSGLAFSFAGLSIACSGPRPTPFNWTAGLDSNGFRAITVSRSVCHQCVEVRRIAILGDTAGEGVLGEEALAVVRDSLGNFWVSQQGGLKVFDSVGVFLRQIGRAGGGPMEFQGISIPVHTDSSGRVHVFDNANRRETIVNGRFQLHEETALPGTIRAAVPLSGGTRYAVNSWLATPDHIGFPLHVIERDDVLYSFGLVTGESGVQSDFSTLRVLATDRLSHIFSAKPYDYAIEAWTAAGGRIGGFKGPKLNLKEVIPGPITADNPPPNKIFAIDADAADHLWVITWQRKDRWLDQMVERVLRSGKVALVMRESSDPYQVMFSTRIDVIDLKSGSIIASRDGEEMFLGFVGNGLTFGHQYMSDGTLQVAIWRVGLNNVKGGAQ